MEIEQPLKRPSVTGIGHVGQLMYNDVFQALRSLFGEFGFSYYDPGTGGVGGPSWSAGWPEIMHLSLTLVVDQPLTGVLEIETAEGPSYFAVYEWGALSTYLRKKAGGYNYQG